MKTGEKIKILREIKKMTPEYIADELGMSVSGYRKIERGNVKLSTDKLEKISAILDVTPHELLANEAMVLNFTDNKNSNNGHTNKNNSIYTFPEDLKQLYEDKIKLLEEKNVFLEEQLMFYKEKNK